MLRAEIEFTKDSYRVHETARLRITLTNTGTTALSGLEAGCDRGGSFQHVLGWYDGSQWAPFATFGATVPAGQSKVFEVTGQVPAASAGSEVFVACDFSTDADYGSEGAPEARDSAAVAAN